MHTFSAAWKYFKITKMRKLKMATRRKSYRLNVQCVCKQWPYRSSVGFVTSTHLQEYLLYDTPLFVCCIVKVKSFDLSQSPSHIQCGNFPGILITQYLEMEHNSHALFNKES